MRVVYNEAYGCFSLSRVAAEPEDQEWINGSQL